MKLKYTKPQVNLLQETGIGTSEIAARTCYNSISGSENQEIINFELSDDYKNIDNSKLLHQLSWVSFHLSVIEHSVLTYHIKNISRGVLQELVRHRIASYSVKSTRYTLSNILYAFVVTFKNSNKEKFNNYLQTFNILNLEDPQLHKIESDGIFNKLLWHYNQFEDKKLFFSLFLSKENLNYYFETEFKDLDIQIFISNKQKRNAGDQFKYIITDNFNTELVWSINLRSLKNFIDLRDSGAAWFQIRTLAEEVIKVTPEKYLKLIMKSHKD